MNTQKEQKPVKDSLAVRREKEAAALRENLKRRKQQQRAKKEHDTDEIK